MLLGTFAEIALVKTNLMGHMVNNGKYLVTVSTPA